ncbi:beta-glucosidase [Kineosporia sp. NBRC 101677]|uniref:glycoside hydrolase family 1 protein n=1 Tax=Kineosporia sp. NBRC 101677 TaxID=3032197 RepID=UPI0024A4E4CC|nr:family 1 glycosylhydrolase [Kineosporia sp. NBRC 101677]GLY14984.1 beta-glucosidase [Kineosporia sp. NBRC 101677]
MSTAFPPGFLWGVATAGHQNEGDNRHSDIWFLEQVEPTVFREPSGQACRSYDLWPTDLDLAQDMGLNAFRFSVEWARIEPQPGVISQEALAHYEAVVDGCLERGLAPVVTFSHFAAPHWFSANGSWTAPDAAQRFADFCALVTRRFGDRIAVAVTLNEPNLVPLLQWEGLPQPVKDLQAATLRAASEKAGVTRYLAGNVMTDDDFPDMRDGLTRAHLAARDAVKAVRPDLPVGLSIAIIDDVARPGGEEIVARKRADVYDHWLELARGDDFIGVQNYERVEYDADGRVALPEGTTLNEMGSAIRPESLGGAVRYAHQVAGVPVLVTEHGMGTQNDSERAAFIEPALAGLQKAVADGVPVLGYCHWTLLDNFEWIFGYGMKFGLHEVDRETFERTPKPSAKAYAAVVAAAR